MSRGTRFRILPDWSWRAHGRSWTPWSGQLTACYSWPSRSSRWPSRRAGCRNPPGRGPAGQSSSWWPFPGSPGPPLCQSGWCSPWQTSWHQEEEEFTMYKIKSKKKPSADVPVLESQCCKSWSGWIWNFSLDPEIFVSDTVQLKWQSRAKIP